MRRIIAPTIPITIPKSPFELVALSPIIPQKRPFVKKKLALEADIQPFEL
jgi:hypothetical protein